MTRQKNKIGNRKGETNHSAEILDRGMISEIPDLPSGMQSSK